jgi:hypothetical protein
MPVRPAISRTLRRLVEQLLGGGRRGRGEGLASGRARGQQIVEEPPSRLTGVGAVLELDLLREHPLLQPRQQMFAERAEHPGLRKMHVAVDETGQDQPVGDGRDDQPYVPRGDLVMRSEVGDPAVLHDQKPVGVEARRFTLASDMPPGIVDEVEECAPDAERGLRRR